MDLYAVLYPVTVSDIPGHRFGFCSAWMPLRNPQTAAGMSTFLSCLYITLTHGKMGGLVPALFHLCHFPPAVIAAFQASHQGGVISPGDKQAMATCFHAVFSLLAPRRAVPDPGHVFGYSLPCFAFLISRKHNAMPLSEASRSYLRVGVTGQSALCPLALQSGGAHAARLENPVFIAPDPKNWLYNDDNGGEDSSMTVVIGNPSEIYSLAQVQVSDVFYREKPELLRAPTHHSRAPPPTSARRANQGGHVSSQARPFRF